MKRASILAALAAALAALPAAAQQVGEITYSEGTVGIVRDGQAVDPSTIGPGTAIDDMDLIQTGDDGSATITTDASSGVSSTINVQPDTSFTVNFADVSTPNDHSVDLLAGSLAFAVNKLAENQNMEVDTDTAVMGIRGTVFDVSTVASGDALLSVSDGKVSCQTDSGGTLYADPGNAVQFSGNTWGNTAYTASGIASFRTKWHANHLATLRAHAGDILKATAERYLALKAKFDASYATLNRQSGVINGWINDSRSRRAVTAREVAAQRSAVAGPLSAAHESLVPLEHVYYRLRRLEALQSQGYAFGDVRPGLSAAAFFAQIERDRPDLTQRMYKLRYFVKVDRARMRAAHIRPQPSEFRESRILRATSRERGPEGQRDRGRTNVRERNDAGKQNDRRQGDERKREDDR